MCDFPRFCIAIRHPQKEIVPVLKFIGIQLDQAMT
jgi:hypothetical protein